MKTAAEWDQDILNITLIIQEKFPELSKYIKEIPVKISEKSKDVIEVKNLEEYYNSLEKLLVEYSKTHQGKKRNKHSEKLKFSDDLNYPSSEDIYSQGKKEMDINPENTSKKKTANKTERIANEESFEEDMSGDDLDVPGAELDDQQESVGSEDEENNYYSLGGDNHNDLEENKG
jgi:hypothetical protein